MDENPASAVAVPAEPAAPAAGMPEEPSRPSRRERSIAVLVSAPWISPAPRSFAQRRDDRFRGRGRFPLSRDDGAPNGHAARIEILYAPEGARLYLLSGGAILGLGAAPPRRCERARRDWRRGPTRTRASTRDRRRSSAGAVARVCETRAPLRRRSHRLARRSLAGSHRPRIALSTLREPQVSARRAGNPPVATGPTVRSSGGGGSSPG